MWRYGRSASRMFWERRSMMMPSLRIRRREYAPAVSSKSAPVSASEPTALEVRSATSATVIGPARGLLLCWRARSWSSSQSSRKNC